MLFLCRPAARDVPNRNFFYKKSGKLFSFLIRNVTFATVASVRSLRHAYIYKTIFERLDVYMKRFLLASALLLCVAAAMAIPAQRGLWKTLVLADGSTVRAELRGDEFMHYWAAEDGTPYVRSGSVFVKADLNAMVAEAQAKRAPVEEVQGARREGLKRVTLGGKHDPYEGEKHCLVILVNFSGTKFSSEHDLDYYKDLTNKEGFTDSYGNIHSVRDYFYDQSYGKLDITFDVAGPVQLIYNYEYYGGNNMANVYKMVTEALAGAENEGVDFSQYDWDGDGEVEQVFILYAGYNSASYDDPDLVWPHMGYLEAYGSNVAPTYDGVKINTYACSSELAGDGAGNGIGAMCHEFSHCMGLPDAYETTNNSTSSTIFGMSFWSLMDSGCYNGGNNGYIPAGYTSYERMYCGWLDPIELTDETEVSDMKGLTEGGEAYIIYNAGYKNEYYLLENRSDYDYDTGLYGHGLLVLHLDYNSNYWASNLVNSLTSGNTHERYTIIPADGSRSWYSVSDLAGDPYPSSSNNHLDNYSSPAAEAYNLNTDGTQMMNISITNIAKASDGTISFRFYPAGADPDHGNKPDGAIFYESFDYCAGTGGNDGSFGSGTGAAAFNPDNSGWVSSTSHGALQCAMFGSNTQAANVVTPTFTIDGETAFSFKAAPYQAAVPGTLAISCETGDVTLSESEVSIAQGEWTNVAFTLSGKGEVSLRIKETSGINRFFMDEVAAVPGDAAGISTVEAGLNRSERKGVYTLSGIYVGHDAAGLKKGVYIVDGKKYIVK